MDDSSSVHTDSQWGALKGPLEPVFLTTTQNIIKNVVKPEMHEVFTFWANSYFVWSSVSCYILHFITFYYYYYILGRRCILGSNMAETGILTNTVYRGSKSSG